VIFVPARQLQLRELGFWLFGMICFPKALINQPASMIAVSPTVLHGIEIKFKCMTLSQSRRQTPAEFEAISMTKTLVSRVVSCNYATSAKVTVRAISKFIDISTSRIYAIKNPLNGTARIIN